MLPTRPLLFGSLGLLLASLGCSSEGANDASGDGMMELPSAADIPTDVASADPEAVRGMVRVEAGAFGRGCQPEVVAEHPALVNNMCETIPEDFVLLDVPHKQITLSEFWIDQHETTREEWDACVQARACVHSLLSDPVASEQPRLPATYVTWYAAEAYCEWRGKRLPTEAEWEKAARGTDNRAFPWGDSAAECDTANVLHNSYPGVDDAELCNSRTIEPVDAHPKDRSPYGVLGMMGNVQEWTADWAARDYYGIAPQVDPPGPDEASAGSRDYKVIRGAYFGAFSMFTFRRRWFEPDRGIDRVGVRCASSSPPDEIDDPYWAQ